VTLVTNYAREIVAKARLRRRGYILAMLLLALLSFVPQPYAARAKIVPQDSNSIGIGSIMNALGGQLQGFAALLGGAKQPIDLYLVVARSTEVTTSVIRTLKLDAPDHYGSYRKAQVKLANKVDIHTLPGGVIEVEVRMHDAEQAKALAGAYVNAITQRLNTLGTEHVLNASPKQRRRLPHSVERIIWPNLKRN
jgi:hypothetical protein